MRDEDKTVEQLIEELKDLRESLRRRTTALQSRNKDLDDLAQYVVSELRRPLGTIVGYAELLEEDCSALSPEDLHYCIQTIRKNGHKLSEMINVLLLLANSHRLFDNVWHAAYLATLGETALSQWARKENIPEAYRFTCLPVSSAPLVLRAWMTGGETPHCEAVAKLGSGPGIAVGEAGPTLQEAQWSPTVEKWSSLVAAVEENDFWTDASSLEQLGWLRMVGTGGEQWIFEGWHDGQYKARAVWNPKDEETNAAYTLGRSFIGLMPGWFALEVAQLWAGDSWSTSDQRFWEEAGLGVVH